MLRLAAVVRVLRPVGVCLIAFLILLGAVVRVQTYLFRQRSERLMADFQMVKLRQSEWPEAERLISRWGKYGGYKGDCTASFCRYSIVLESPETTIEALAFHVVREHQLVYPTASLLFTLCEILGGRSATLRTSFVVQDGVVVRKSTSFIYNVPPATYLRDGYSLIATSRAKSRLTFDGWPLTHSEQLAEHPYYVVTRPGGCSFCLMANVTFAPDAPEPEMRRLTTFNLACLTSLLPCRYLEDIYPASEGWHLYDDTYGGRPALSSLGNGPESPDPVDCRVPIFARGREADQIFSVTSLEESQEKRPDEIVERAKVRVESVLKGLTRHTAGDVIAVTSHASYIPMQIEKPLAPGKHFLLLAVHPQEESQPLDLERCLVLPDTPEIRAQLQQGIAQNDSLRYPDPNSGLFIPD